MNKGFTSHVIPLHLKKHYNLFALFFISHLEADGMFFFFQVASHFATKTLHLLLGPFMLLQEPQALEARSQQTAEDEL